METAHAVSDMQKKMICVVGPTASGKSSLAAAIAERFCGEVVSCDSMQIYRGMDIGTAKTTPEQMRGIPHHLVDVLDICEPFSVSDYVKCASAVADGIYARRNIPVFCGGTGLYIDSFVSGLSFNDYESKPGLREELAGFARQYGHAALYERLKKADPESAQKIPSENVKRVIRALEVYETTGIPFSEWSRRAAQKAVRRDALYIGLFFEDRAKLYERIDRRVEEMMTAGLLAETERLIRQGLRETPTAGQAIGYKEFYPYFDGEQTLEACVERLKINSRHYAKRQLTWFSRNPAIHPLTVDTVEPETLYAQAYALCSAYLGTPRSSELPENTPESVSERSKKHE